MEYFKPPSLLILTGNFIIVSLNNTDYNMVSNRVIRAQCANEASLKANSQLQPTSTSSPIIVSKCNTDYNLYCPEYRLGLLLLFSFVVFMQVLYLHRFLVFQTMGQVESHKELACIHVKKIVTLKGICVNTLLLHLSA